MKLILKYLKPFVPLMIICLVLLFGQAMCDLALPNLMGDIVNVGIQQGGIEAGAPKAVSQQGMELLKLFLTEEEQGVMDGFYNTFEPESSEGVRLSESYPLLREEAVCVRREGLTEEELDTADALYRQAAYGFLLYLQTARESGVLEETAQQFQNMQDRLDNREPTEYGGNVKLPDSEASFPEGVLGSIPEDALYDLPESGVLQREGESSGDLQGGEADQETAQIPEDGESGETAELYEELSGIDVTELYALIPLIGQAPPEEREEAMAFAKESTSTLGDRVGAVMKKLFYAELGMDVDKIQSDYILGTGLRMLGAALLEAVAAVLAGFFAARIAAAVGRRLHHDLFSEVESFGSAEFDQFSTIPFVTCTIKDVQRVQMLVTVGIRMVCYAPIIGIGGIILAVQKSVSISWTVAAVLIGLIAVGLAVALLKFNALQKLIDRLNLADTNRFIQRVMTVMMPAMMLIMNLVSLIIVWVGGRAIASSPFQIGDMIAFIQYATQIIMAFLMIAVMFVMVPRVSVSASRIREVLDKSPSVRDPEN